MPVTSVRERGLLRQIRKVVAAQCPSRQSDRQLVQRFLAEHDEAAFQVLVERHGPMVLGVCRNVLQHLQDAEDVFQAVFLVLARKAHTIRKQQALSSWLHGVAYRLALKARSRRRLAFESFADRESSSASPVDALTVRELTAILHAELRRLPESSRSPLLLCYWEGKTRDEAAEQLGMTAGSFKKRLEQARKLLGSRLTRRGVAPTAALLATLLADTTVRAAVPYHLIQRTAEAALEFAAGKPALALASAAAVNLAKGTIQAMNITKWATALIVSILLIGLGGALGLSGYQALWGQEPGGQGPPAAQQGQGKDSPKVDTAKPDAEKIVGTWRLAEGLSDGDNFPAEMTALGRFTFTKDGSATFTVVNQKLEGPYKVVGAGKIDVTINKEEPGPGIYKFDGKDRLILCFTKDAAAKKRPTEFTGEKKSGQTLIQLTRAKPGEEKPSDDEIARFQRGLVGEAAVRTLSANHLKQIGLAMHNYHDAYGNLPLHAIYSKDGKTPLLSWRVAILPYLDHEELYKEFKLDEPWDSKLNKKLIAKMPEIYAIDLGPKVEGKTYYQVFTGPGTVFDGANKMKLTDITDGLSDTLLVVEAKEAVEWTKPGGLVLPKEGEKLPPLGGLFKNGFHALLCDGGVRMFPHSIDAKLLRAVITPRGGEELPTD